MTENEDKIRSLLKSNNLDTVMVGLTLAKSLKLTYIIYLVREQKMISLSQSQLRSSKLRYSRSDIITRRKLEACTNEEFFQRMCNK